MRLEEVTLPTLIVHNESDDRKITHYGGVRAQHGFLGLDAEVGRAIAEWIK